MSLLATLRNLRPRFLLLFPHATPEIADRHDKAFEVLEGWLTRPSDDHLVPGTIVQAEATARRAIDNLRAGKGLLAEEEFGLHLIVDTNVLLDDPDLARFTDAVGRRYLVHLLPVVLRELDDHKRAGRNADLRESAKRADRRLKGLRDNGDLSVGAKVAGDVWSKSNTSNPAPMDSPAGSTSTFPTTGSSLPHCVDQPTPIRHHPCHYRRPEPSNKARGHPTAVPRPRDLTPPRPKGSADMRSTQTPEPPDPFAHDASRCQESA